MADKKNLSAPMMVTFHYVQMDAYRSHIKKKNSEKR